MRIYNTYFKGAGFISGLPLPPPGIHEFIDCDFHPAVRIELIENYSQSTFKNCRCCMYQINSIDDLKRA